MSTTIHRPNESSVLAQLLLWQSQIFPIGTNENTNLRKMTVYEPLRPFSEPKMSSLYPSLEDMQVHKVMVAQENAASGAYVTANAYSQGGYPQLTSSRPDQSSAVAALYPGLGDFMGLELSNDVIALNMPEYMQSNQAVSVTLT